MVFMDDKIDAADVLVCNRTRIRSNGAVAVLDITPAKPPFNQVKKISLEVYQQ